MTSYWKVPAVVAVFVAWLASPPTGLADASRREALRRQLVPKATRSLSNQDLPTVPPETVTVMSGGATGEAAQAAAAAAAAAADEDGVKPATQDAAGQKPAEGDAKRDEAWWRDRIAKARATLAAQQKKVADLQLKIDLLTTQAVNRDNPVQQNKLWTDRQVALKDFEAAQAQVAVDQKAIVDIQEEARRAGVPPGWIR
jgi:hypothetical protein